MKLHYIPTRLVIPIPVPLYRLYVLFLHSHTSWRDWLRWWRFHDYAHLVHYGMSDADAFQRRKAYRGLWYWMMDNVKWTT